MAKPHEGAVTYHDERHIIHFGSPVGLTFFKPDDNVDTQPKTVTP